jgi:hypothetical protein
VVQSHAIQDSTAVYALTKNRLLREGLRKYVESRAVAMERT